MARPSRKKSRKLRNSVKRRSTARRHRGGVLGLESLKKWKARQFPSKMQKVRKERVLAAIRANVHRKMKEAELKIKQGVSP